MKGAMSAFVFLSMCAVALGGCVSAPERVLSKVEPPYAVLVTGKNPLKPSELMHAKGVTAGAQDFIRFYERQRGHALNVLLLSGGGQNGAFGAGVLVGWRERGTRPQFDVVTGVSTGALLATFAFLGTPADDLVLKKIVTDITRRNIYTERGALSVLGGADSLLDTAPLKALIAEHVTSEVLARVAAEQAKGRRLFVGTTNLDYNETWAWDMGLIAAEGGADALELYRKVLVASAAFPVMFPPIEIDGHLFGDGGIRMNLLVPGLSGNEPPGPPLFGPGNYYIIRNGQIARAPKAVPEDLIELAGTSLGEMLSSSTEALLLRAYFSAMVHGYRFHMVSLPDDVHVGANSLAFDQGQMRAGFEAGYELGKQPNPWSNQPPLLGDIPEWGLELIKQKL